MKNQVADALYRESERSDENLTNSLRSLFPSQVQWHNMAFTVTADLDLPELIFHYESYTTNFAKTIDRLLTFLELEAIGVPEPFTPGKTYGEYYSAEEKRAIEAFVKEYSNKKSWKYFEHYFL